MVPLSSELYMEQNHQMKIRLPLDINQWVREKAKKEDRSLNYIIVAFLRKVKSIEEGEAK